jgi:hypothetical protein
MSSRLRRLAAIATAAGAFSGLFGVQLAKKAGLR